MLIPRINERTGEPLWVIDRAFVGNCKSIFNLKETGNVIYKELYGTNVTESCGEIKNSK